MNLHDTFLCSSRVHCPTCRDKEDSSIRDMFVGMGLIPSNDFECPNGIPWGYEADTIQRLPHDDGKKLDRIAVCETCKQYDLSGTSPKCNLLGECSSRWDLVVKGFSAPPETCLLLNMKNECVSIANAGE